MTRQFTRPDTGHPFGFLRVLLHEDGHALALSNAAELNPQIEAMWRLFAELGLGDAYRLGWLPVEDAAAAQVLGQGCERCRPRLSCRCDVIQDVLTGRCRHGVRRAVMAAAARTGYYDHVSPPAGGASALATALVAADAGRRRKGRR